MPGQSELAVPGMANMLRPYLSLATAVRSGDVTAFNTVAMQNSDIFLSDQTHNLINRLRYNVLRAGLRRISIAYSRISLQVWASANICHADGRVCCFGCCMCLVCETFTAVAAAHTKCVSETHCTEPFVVQMT